MLIPESSPEKLVTDDFSAGLGNLNAAPPLVNGFDQGVGGSFLTRGSASALRTMRVSASDAELPAVPVGVTLTDLGASRVEATQRTRVGGGVRIHRAEYAVSRGSWRLQKWNVIEQYDGVTRRGYRETTATVRSLRVRRNVARDAMRVHAAQLTVMSDAIMYAPPVRQPTVPEAPAAGDVVAMPHACEAFRAPQSGAVGGRLLGECPPTDYPPPPPISPPPPPTPCEFSAVAPGAVGGSLLGGCPPVDPPPPSAPPAPPASCQFTATRGEVTGPRVALQHGILSDACTWTGGYPANLFARAVNVRALRVTETTSSNRYVFQAEALRSQTQQLQTGPYVIVGHSNGGVVGRMAARTFGTGSVAGVVTLGTPHAGAPIVRFNRQVALLAGTVATSDALFATVTLVFGQEIGLVGSGIGLVGSAIARTKAGPGLLFAAGGVGTLLIQGSQDVFSEMSPGPFAAAGLNLLPEPVYTKIALFSETPQRWISARIACDQFGGGGAGCVKRMERAARWAFFTSIIGTVAGIAGFTPGFAVAQFAGSWLAKMWAIDRLYRWVVSDGAASDGIVPATSQRAFPNLTLPPRRILGDPTHLMMTKTRAGREALEDGLRNNGAFITGSPPGS